MGTLMILRMRTSDVASAISDCAQVILMQKACQNLHLSPAVNSAHAVQNASECFFKLGSG